MAFPAAGAGARARLLSLLALVPAALAGGCYRSHLRGGAIVDGGLIDDGAIDGGSVVLEGVVQISAGSGFTCARLELGETACWGTAAAGQLGTPEARPSRSRPRLVTALPESLTIATGNTHACAVSASGGLSCWGYLGGEGQLGNGSRTGSGSPVAVSGLSGLVDIGPGHQHSCALAISGEVSCWGFNRLGQLGDGDVPHDTCDAWGDCATTPIFVPGVDDAVEVDAGKDHTCVRLRSGAVLCWGANGDGQLGDGTMIDRSTPTPVVGVDDAVDIACGDFHTCALRRTGEVNCWGYAAYGQLGDGDGRRVRCTSADATGECSPSAVVVSDLRDAASIDAGSRRSCAVRADGTAVCWGIRFEGGVWTRNSTPVPIAGLTNALAVSIGGDHACALEASGLALCWGPNLFGQLGDGTMIDREMPTRVVGLE